MRMSHLDLTMIMPAPGQVYAAEAAGRVPDPLSALRAGGLAGVVSVELADKHSSQDVKNGLSANPVDDSGEWIQVSSKTRDQ